MTAINLDTIGYVDEPEEAWVKGLDAAKSRADLRALAELYAPLVQDACAQIDKMDDEAFEDFKHGLRKERKGRFAGEEFMEKFGAILLPEMMMHVGMVMAHFGVPFGLAFRRLRENGMIEVRDGIAVLAKQGA